MLRDLDVKRFGYNFKPDIRKNKRSGRKIKIAHGAIIFLVALNIFLYWTVLGSHGQLIEIGGPPASPTETPLSLKLTPRPTVVKGIYVTANTARISRFKDLVALVKRTELNAMVIDVKDGWATHFDKYLKELVSDLHRQKIYAIARIVVFQDQRFAESNPDAALKIKNGKYWSDNKSTYWVDPASKKVWDHNIVVAKQAIDFGFDELNFDYVRFPSEKTDSIVYPVYDGKTPKYQVIRSFWQYLCRNIKQYDPEIILSADLFAFNMINDGDLGIGQRFRDSLGIFDVVAPMVYPSHYSTGNFNFKNPAEHPYEVVYQSLLKGRGQIALFASTTLTTIRPWLQDFDLGADYTAAMVRQEIKAVSDAGFNKGWLLWNPSNVYTEGALNRE